MRSVERRRCPHCHRSVAVNPVTQLFRAHHQAPAGSYCPASGEPALGYWTQEEADAINQRAYERWLRFQQILEKDTEPPQLCL